MSRGITQEDVWKACDALLLEGARPTIERVRQKIGRGSPNTVSPFLETWFKHLGGRIKDPGAFAAPPALPDPVQQAAQHFWETALAQTRLDFDERLREGMAAAVANVEAEKERAAIAEAAAFDASSKATHLQNQLADSQALLEQERLGHAATKAHYQEACARGDELKARILDLEASLAQVRETARRDVAAAVERSTAAERRALKEIDAERTARANADKRFEALERKLGAAVADAQAAHARQVEVTTQLRGEKARLSHDLAHAQDTIEASSSRLANLVAELAQAQRDAHAARAEAALAERLVTGLRPIPNAVKRPRASATSGKRERSTP